MTRKTPTETSLFNMFSLFFALMLALPSLLCAAENTLAANKTAVSLSYDDALDSQLDNAVPALNKHGFKASFYVVPNTAAFAERLEEWRLLAQQGHELGNHTIKHSCQGSLPNRDWVLANRDLDKQTVEQVVEEVLLANTLLQALDGQTERTFTVPCGDLLAGGENYVAKVADRFIAIKGQGIASGFASLHSPVGDSGEQLIDHVKKQTGKVKLINILFHGIGGDHLSVSTEAHSMLLAFLAQNPDKYRVDTYINIMRDKTEEPLQK